MTDYIALLPDELVVKILCQFLVKSNLWTPALKNRYYWNFAATCKRINGIAKNLTYCEEWKAHGGFAYPIVGKDVHDIFNRRRVRRFGSIGLDNFVRSLNAYAKRKPNLYKYIHGRFHSIYWLRFLDFKYRKFNTFQFLDKSSSNYPYDSTYFEPVHRLLDEFSSTNLDSICRLNLYLPSITVGWLDNLLHLLKNINYLQINISNNNNTTDASSEPCRTERRLLNYLVVVKVPENVFDYLKEKCPASTCIFYRLSKDEVKGYLTRNVKEFKRVRYGGRYWCKKGAATCSQTQANTSTSRPSTSAQVSNLQY